MKTAITLLALLFIGCKEWNIKPGQIWVKKYNTDNPYEKIELEYRTVLDVQDDYVLYATDGDTSSDSKYWFTKNAEIFKDAVECK